MRIWKRIDLGAERRSYDLPIDGTVTTVYKVVVRVRARARVRVGVRVRASADPYPNPHPLTLTLTLTATLPPTRPW